MSPLLEHQQAGMRYATPVHQPGMFAVAQQPPPPSPFPVAPMLPMHGMGNQQQQVAVPPPRSFAHASVIGPGIAVGSAGMAMGSAGIAMSSGQQPPPMHQIRATASGLLSSAAAVGAGTAPNVGMDLLGGSAAEKPKDPH